MTTKADVLEALKFPSLWAEIDFYPEEMYEIQKSELTWNEETSSFEEIADSEHFRYSVFCWWFKNAKSTEEFDKLDQLASLDPDKAMGKSVLKELKKLREAFRDH